MRLLYPKAVWRGDHSKPDIFLTFDDGPVPDVTPQVLNILRETGIHASFFCIGDNVRKYPELYLRIREEGHLTGNHTFHHVNGFKTTTENYLQDVADCASCVQSSFFRPPYGRMKQKQYRTLKSNYRLIMWDVLSKDYDTSMNAQQCRDNVLNNCRNGSIIVFHDSVKASGNLLPILRELIVALKENYHFATLDRLQDKRNS